ncbi:MAG: hypothetical protein ABSF56_02405 [Minisyncoccia bacterium]|jgi:hypothetical protein
MKKLLIMLGILSWIGSLISAGIFMIVVLHSRAGIVVGGLGFVAIALGWTNLSPDPLELGMLTCWGRAVKTGRKTPKEDTRKTIALRGKVILADYFPFFIGVKPIDMTSKEWVFNMIILTVEDTVDDRGNQRSVAVPVRVHIPARPDKEHLNSYIQSGRDLDKIKELMGGIPYREVQRLVKTMEGADHKAGLNFIELVQHGDLISRELEKHLKGDGDHKGVLEERSFGVECQGVQIEATIPEKINQSMTDAVSIVYETDARATESKGDIATAKLFMTELGLDEQAAWNAAVEARLVRDEHVNRLQIESKGEHPVSGIVLRDTIVNMAQGGNKGGKS